MEPGLILYIPLLLLLDVDFGAFPKAGSALEYMGKERNILVYSDES
jgi:hypothetical protein